MAKKKYVLVGAGGRSRMFVKAVLGEYKKTSDLVGICDTNQVRMDYLNKKIVQEEFKHRKVRTYDASEFDKMIKKEKPYGVIVCTIDRTHHDYIIRALDLGCHVITEKPMTIDAEKCQEILDAVERNRKKVRVTFNYRYSPVATKVRELIMNNTIGDVTSIHFEWLLDTNHGADYFRRWHRDKNNSGGLMVHKSTHHFDLVNFWINSSPQEVFGMGDLRFYGKENANKRGEFQQYVRGSEESKLSKKCPFALNMNENKNLKELYLKAEHIDGYIRDQNVFSDGISIEDTMGVMVRYQNKAILTYSLNAYMPWEGFNVNINGTKGRLQVQVAEKSYFNGAGEIEDEGASAYKSIFVLPQFEKPYEVEVKEGKGGHGGGDVVMLNDIFGTPKKDKFKRAADHKDGAMSILTGIAANQSFNTGLPVKVKDLVKFYE